MKGTQETGSPFVPGIRLVAIGDELLDGHTQDTNCREIARGLDSLGLRPLDLHMVRDQEAAIQAEVRELLDPAGPLEIVISTGGLGPTLDDRTRQTLATAFGAELVFDEERWAQLLAWFAERGRVPGPLQRSQALHPIPGGALHNPVGTANGLFFERGQRLWIALPGVPSEMRHLLSESVLPLLARRLGARPQGRVLAFRSRRLPEADLSNRLEPLADLLELGEVGFYPSPDGVLLRLRLPALSEDDAAAAEGRARRLVRERLGEYLLAESGAPVVELVFQALQQRGERLALAESCTGGWLARELTEFPGSSAVFPGGVVAYSNAVKSEVLGVPPELLDKHGAVSAACAGALALGVKLKLKAEWGLALTGIAGPAGGTPEKPVGTVWLGLAGPRSLETRRLDLRGNREQIRQRAAGQAWAWLLEVLNSDS